MHSSLFMPPEVFSITRNSEEFVKLDVYQLMIFPRYFGLYF